MFKGIFKLPERAAALFRTKLPKALSAKISWDTLTPIPGSFISPKLAAFHTDLLFSVRLGESELLLYLLLEHHGRAGHAVSDARVHGLDLEESSAAQ